MIAPSLFQRRERAGAAPGSSPSGAVKLVGVTGPSPSSLPRRISTSASSRDQSRLRLVGGRRDFRLEPRLGPEGPELVSRSAGSRASPAALEQRDALVARQRVEPVAPRGRGASLGFGQAAEPEQGVVQLLGVDRIGPRFGANPAIASDRAGRDRRRSPDRASAAP